MTKITDPEKIQQREKEFLDRVIEDLDWATIEKILKEADDLQIRDRIETNQSDIVIHNRDIAYRFDFNIRFHLSLLFDRLGNTIDFKNMDLNQSSYPVAPPQGSRRRYRTD